MITSEALYAAAVKIKNGTLRSDVLDAFWVGIESADLALTGKRPTEAQHEAAVLIGIAKTLQECEDGPNGTSHSDIATWFRASGLEF